MLWGIPPIPAGLHQALEINATGIGSAPVFGNQPGRVGRATRKEWGNLTDARANTHQSELDAALRYQGVRHFILAAWKDSRHLLQTSSWGSTSAATAYSDRSCRLFATILETSHVARRNMRFIWQR
jgi:hypothetical protein